MAGDWQIWYRKLLKKYMKHIADCEGTCYIEKIHQYSSYEKFTKEEQDRLKLIEQEIEAENK